MSDLSEEEDLGYRGRAETPEDSVEGDSARKKRKDKKRRKRTPAEKEARRRRRASSGSGRALTGREQQQRWEQRREEQRRRLNLLIGKPRLWALTCDPRHGGWRIDSSVPLDGAADR